MSEIVNILSFVAVAEFIAIAVLFFVCVSMADDRHEHRRQCEHWKQKHQSLIAVVQANISNTFNAAGNISHSMSVIEKHLEEEACEDE